MKRLFNQVALLLVAVAFTFFSGCSDGGTDPDVPNVYQISGSVTASGMALPGVTVELTGEQSSTSTTDANGLYSFGDLENGDYTLTPTKDAYVFTPANSIQTVAGADIESITFTGAHHLLEGIIAYYPFDQDADDASGNGNNGTVSGAEWDNIGFLNECLSFNDGVTTNNVTTGVNLSTTIFTLNLWAKQETSAKITLAGTMTHPSGGKTGFMFHSGGYGGADYGCATMLSWQSNNTWLNLFGTSPVLTDVWNMYTYIYVSGGTSKIYQNGILTASLPNSPAGPSHSTALQIGRAFTTITNVNQVWGGLIDEVGVWERELTQDEVTAIYNSGSGLQLY
ncbi:MAG: hypothetical protein GY835_03780 [bacterium]|nr:hypothetical protein [bacterium]